MFMSDDFQVKFLRFQGRGGGLKLQAWTVTLYLNFFVFCCDYVAVCV